MKDPILEELRRIRSANFEERQRDPEAYSESLRRLMSETHERGADGIWYPKPRTLPLDPVAEALWEAETLPRVARKIRRRKILAREAAQRFENAKRILAEKKSG
jgi:hypothetical protein